MAGNTARNAVTNKAGARIRSAMGAGVRGIERRFIKLLLSLRARRGEPRRGTHVTRLLPPAREIKWRMTAGIVLALLCCAIWPVLPGRAIAGRTEPVAVLELF